MNESDKKIRKIEQFINDYMTYSQKRGNMYGSISELEKNWVLLDQIYFILKELRKDEIRKCNFASFLLSKGCGAKDASTVIKQRGATDPYSELNKFWNEYIEWRKLKIRELEMSKNKQKILYRV